MRKIVTRLQEIQFKNTNPRYAPPDQKYSEFTFYLMKLVKTFLEEPADESDDVMLKLRDEFPRDLQMKALIDGKVTGANEKTEISAAIPHMLPKFKKWIKKLEQKIRSKPDYMILDSTKYTYLDEDVEVPGESMNPRDPRNFVKLVKVLPIVNIVDRYDSIGKEIEFLGNNGRTYAYLFIYQEQSHTKSLQMESQREDRVCQLQRLLEPLLAKGRRTSWRAMDINSQS